MVTQQESICLRYQNLKFLSCPKKQNRHQFRNTNKSTKLIHTVSAACKNIPCSDEAATEARTKLFSMWYSLGPPSVFFTISPGDECSFRIKLYLNLKIECLLKPIIDDENTMIFDSVFRSKLRIDNPSACAREYNSIMQIIMEALVGWDFKEGKERFFGIFGEVLGWSGTTEEQGRKTLHLHILLFIALFDRLITMLWSTSEELKGKAKDELTKYTAQTMSSSYKIDDEYYTHEKKRKRN
jgi:hypothetical protein